MLEWEAYALEQRRCPFTSHEVFKHPAATEWWLSLQGNADTRENTLGDNRAIDHHCTPTRCYSRENTSGHSVELHPCEVYNLTNKPREIPSCIEVVTCEPVESIVYPSSGPHQVTQGPDEGYQSTLPTFSYKLPKG